MKKLSIAGYVSIIYLLFVISGFKASNTQAVFSMVTMLVLGVMLIKSGLDLPNMILKDKCGVLLIVYLVLCYLVLSVTRSSQINYVLSRLNLFMPIIMFLYFKEEKDSIKPMIYISLIIWAFISIRAVILYSTGVVSARDMASGNVAENVMTGGGYGFAIGSAILAVYMLEMLLWKKIKANIFNIAFIILLCLVVFYTQSTITIIALFFGLVLSFILKMFNVSDFRNVGAKQIVVLLIMIFAVLLLYIGKERLGNYIIAATKGSENIVFIRLKEVGNLLVYGSESGAYTGSDMANRIGKIGESFQTFIKYPVLGAMLEYGSDFYALAEVGIGSHGEIMDALGRYGIILATPYLGMFFYSVFRERKMQESSIGFGYIVSFLIMIFFNPFIFSQSTLVLFFIVPMMTYFYNSDKEEEITEKYSDETLKKEQKRRKYE